MAKLNKCLFIGHVGKEAPQLRTNAENKRFCRFSLAVDQGKESEPMWLTIVCLGDLAEIAAKLLFKGAQTYVEGRLQIRTYKDAKQVEKVAVEIIARDIQLLEKQKKTDDDLPDGLLDETPKA